MPPEHKLQALSGQPPARRDEAALRALQDELRALLDGRSGPDVSGDPATRDRLRLYVSRLKETGYSPEGMLIHLKQLFLGFRRPRGDAEERTLSALLDVVVRTCIEEYFGFRRV